MSRRLWGPKRYGYLAWGLLSGRVHFGDWQDRDGNVIPDSAGWEKYERSDVWAILGPCPSAWWWMRKWGTLECGCGRNPLTRRMSWYLSGCELHVTRSTTSTETHPTAEGTLPPEEGSLAGNISATPATNEVPPIHPAPGSRYYPFEPHAFVGIGPDGKQTDICAEEYNVWGEFCRKPWDDPIHEMP